MEKLTLKKDKTALVVIDLQKGIVAMPVQPYTPDIVIGNASKLAQAFRAQKMPVFLVHVTMTPDKQGALHPDSDQPMQIPASRPSDWADFVDGLDMQETDLVITKRQWGAFYGTELDLQLRRRGIETIVLCGISTNIGVESTARDAYERGYQQVFVEDACSARSEGEHAHTMQVLFPRIGKIRLTEDVLAAL